MRSTVEPYRQAVGNLVEAGVEAATIWQRLRQDHGYTGSYSSVLRFVKQLAPQEPKTGF
jgi:hypothetical protein